jgi:hypothetical protein
MEKRLIYTQSSHAFDENGTIEPCTEEVTFRRSDETTI